MAVLFFVLPVSQLASGWHKQSRSVPWFMLLSRAELSITFVTLQSSTHCRSTMMRYLTLFVFTWTGYDRSRLVRRSVSLHDRSVLLEDPTNPSGMAGSPPPRAKQRMEQHTQGSCWVLFTVIADTIARFIANHWGTQFAGQALLACSMRWSNYQLFFL